MTREVLEFRSAKTEKPRVVVLPESAIAALKEHRKRQDEFRMQYGSDYRADLDLIFANPNGTMLKPDSISASVSALFRRLKIPKPKGAALHLLRHSHTSVLLGEGVPLPAVSAPPGPQLSQDDPGDLRAHDHRPGREGGAEVGGVPEAEPATNTRWRPVKSIHVQGVRHPPQDNGTFADTAPTEANRWKSTASQRSSGPN
jgi:hypothetical protein